MDRQIRMMFANVNPGLVTLAERSERPRLAQQGEPGMGKTTVMQSERAAIELAVAASGDALIWIDLGDSIDEARLIRDLFWGDNRGRWGAGDQTLRLYLDGLDECRLYVPGL